MIADINFDCIDFYLQADPDSYVMVDNLRHYLSQRNSSEPEIYGHALWFPQAGYFQTHFVAGQAVVLTRESLRRLVEEALIKHPGCFTPGQGKNIGQWPVKVLGYAGFT